MWATHTASLVSIGQSKLKLLSGTQKLTKIRRRYRQYNNPVFVKNLVNNHNYNACLNFLSGISDAKTGKPPCGCHTTNCTINHRLPTLTSRSRRPRLVRICSIASFISVSRRSHSPFTSARAFFPDASSSDSCSISLLQKYSGTLLL